MYGYQHNRSIAEEPPAKPRREPFFGDVPAPVLWLAAVMVLIHAARLALSEDSDFEVLLWFAFVPERFAADAAEMGYPGGPVTAAMTFVSYALLHVDWLHVLANTAMLLPLGASVARRVGGVRFLAFCVATAAGGALAHLLSHPGAGVPMIGASGIVSGLLGGLLRFRFGPQGLRPDLAGRAEQPRRSLLSLARDPQAILLIAGLVVTNLLLVAGADAFAGPDSSIAWQAHAGGFLAGLLGFPLFDRPDPRSAP